MAEIDEIAKMCCIRFRHFHDERTGRLLATIATQYSDREKQWVMVSVAVCSKKDNPSKLLGKRIAMGRLATHGREFLRVSFIDMLKSKTLLTELTGKKFKHR